MTKARRPRRRPRLAVFKLASCDGCQLTLLNLEDELLTLAETVEIAHFTEATPVSLKGPYDLTLVEGSVSTPEDERRIRDIRARSRFLVTIGACATSGGIQALRNFADSQEFLRAVYAKPEYISTLARSTPVAESVKVDFELRGCPIDKGQLLEVLRAFLAGARPQVREHSVCVECKREGRVCVMVAQGRPCLGPVTHAGCGALCPGVDRGCYGCFGPAETAQTASLSGWLTQEQRLSAERTRDLFRGMNAWSPPFRKAAEDPE